LKRSCSWPFFDHAESKTFEERYIVDVALNCPALQSGCSSLPQLGEVAAALHEPVDAWLNDLFDDRIDKACVAIASFPFLIQFYLFSFSTSSSGV
jgi:hypothetical protein